MGYLFSIAAGLIGGVAAVLLIERRRSNKRRRARSRAEPPVTTQRRQLPGMPSWSKRETQPPGLLASRK